jgi:hypothetical protein
MSSAPPGASDPEADSTFGIDPMLLTLEQRIVLEGKPKATFRNVRYSFAFSFRRAAKGESSVSAGSRYSKSTPGLRG